MPGQGKQHASGMGGLLWLTMLQYQSLQHANFIVAGERKARNVYCLVRRHGDVVQDSKRADLKTECWHSQRAQDGNQDRHSCCFAQKLQSHLHSINLLDLQTQTARAVLYVHC